MLNDTLVLDLADGEAGLASRLLADLGATVLKIEGPEGDPTRQEAGGGASFLYANTNKRGVLLDLKTPEGKENLLRLISSADVLIENFSLGAMELMETGQPHRSNPRLIHISMAGSDCHSCYTAALFAANAALISLRKRKFTGEGRHLDLSMPHAAAPADLISGNAVGDRREDFPIFRCKEGYIQIPVFRNWDTLIELLNREGKAGNLLEPEWREQSYRESHAGPILSLVEDWTRSHTREQLFELGQSMGFPWAPVASFEDVVASPQLKARQFFVPVSSWERTVYVPGMPYKFSTFSPAPSMRAPLLGEHNGQFLLGRSAALKDQSGRREEVNPDSSSDDRDILKGIRVLDLTRMISGPYATRILADFGAEVIKVQSRLTARGAEQNDTPPFAKWNRNKRSITLNLSRSEARALFLELVAISDIVVENFSPRVMANWQLDYDRLRVIKPDLIMASISAMGRTGPWRNFVGFAPTFHALSGLTFASSQSLDVPQDLGHEYGDVVTGLYASLAILASIEHRSKTGSGQHIDLSGYEALCTLVGPALIMVSAGKYVRASRFSNRCYQCILSDRSILWPGTDASKGCNPAPSLGEANCYAFRELLGYSEADYLSFIDKKIIY